MENVMITEMNLAARLFQCGIMKYLNQDDLVLHMTDFCYSSKPRDYNRDKDFVREMISHNQIKIVELGEDQVARTSILLKQYYPKFLLKTVATMVAAKEQNFILVSEDELIRDTALKDFAIKAYDKGWLIDYMIRNLDNSNQNFNPAMLRLVI